MLLITSSLPSARQAAVAGNDDRQRVLDLGALRQQRVQGFASRLFGHVREHLPGFPSVGACGGHCLDGFAHFARADSLQGARDLRDVAYAPHAEPH